MVPDAVLRRECLAPQCPQQCFLPLRRKASNVPENIAADLGQELSFTTRKYFCKKNGHNNLGRGSYARFTFFECFFAEM